MPAVGLKKKKKKKKKALVGHRLHSVLRSSNFLNKTKKNFFLAF